MKEQISLAFALIADLGNKSGAAPASKFAGCWEYQVNDHWWIALNGHDEPVCCSEGAEVPPFHCYVEFNGWPAGLLNPYGGTIIAGGLANEDAFIAALERRLGEDEGPTKPEAPKTITIHDGMPLAEIRKLR